MQTKHSFEYSTPPVGHFILYTKLLFLHPTGQDAGEFFTPGVTCQPRPIGLENDNFQVDLSELPDFDPDYFLEESARAIDGVPGKILLMPCPSAWTKYFLSWTKSDLS